MIKSLHVYDFDGTLFRSPEEPPWWHHKGWWTDPASLKSPCVPSQPPDDWWVGSVLKRAKESIADEETYTVLLTGRRDGTFNSRVKVLLSQAELEFDEVHLSTQEDSQAFKIAELKRLVKEHPDLETVEMWEDRPGQLPPFKYVIESAGIKFVAHKVDAAAKPAQCRLTDDGKLIERVAARWAARQRTGG